MANIEDLAPVIVKTAKASGKPAPGEEVISYNNKMKTITKVEFGKLDQISGNVQHYLVSFNRKYHGKTDQVFEYEDIASAEYFKYELHYDVWFEMHDPGRWQHAVQLMLSAKSPVDCIENLIIESVEKVAGFDNKTATEGDEQTNLLLSALREDPSETVDKAEFGQKVDELLTPNGFCAFVKIVPIIPDFAPVEFDREVSTTLKAFPGEITIQAKGCLEKDDSCSNLARKKQYLVHQYLDRIPSFIKLLFSNEVTVQLLQAGCNSLASTAQELINKEFQDIGHKLVYLTFSPIKDDILPAKKIKTEFLLDCNVREYSQKVSFHCDLNLLLNSDANIIRWQTAEETIDWAKRSVLEIIDNADPRSILEYNYSDGWKEFNKQFEVCGYHVDKNGYKIMPDIEPVRLKERGFRLDFEEEYLHSGQIYPIKLQVSLEGKLADGNDAFDKIKPYLGNRSIIDQVKEKIVAGIYSKIKTLSSGELHSCLQMAESTSEGKKLISSIIDLLKKSLLEEFNIVLEAEPFLIRLVDSWRIQREGTMTAGLKEVNLAITANSDASQKMKGDFKITYFLEGISEDGWQLLAGKENSYPDPGTELDQINTVIEEFTKAKIANADIKLLETILAEENQGAAELEKLVLKNQDLPKQIKELFGIQIKLNSIRKLNIQVERVEAQDMIKVQKGKLAILSELQAQLLVLLEKRREFFSQSKLDDAAVEDLNQGILSLEQQISTYEKNSQFI
jgi:hypothetical protein